MSNELSIKERYKAVKASGDKAELAKMIAELESSGHKHDWRAIGCLLDYYSSLPLSTPKEKSKLDYWLEEGNKYSVPEAYGHQLQNHLSSKQELSEIDFEYAAYQLQRLIHQAKYHQDSGIKKAAAEVLSSFFREFKQSNPQSFNKFFSYLRANRPDLINFEPPQDKYKTAPPLPSSVLEKIDHHLNQNYTDVRMSYDFYMTAINKLPPLRQLVESRYRNAKDNNENLLSAEIIACANHMKYSLAKSGIFNPADAEHFLRLMLYTSMTTNKGIFEFDEAGAIVKRLADEGHPVACFIMVRSRDNNPLNLNIRVPFSNEDYKKYLNIAFQDAQLHDLLIFEAKQPKSTDSPTFQAAHQSFIKNIKDLLQKSARDGDAEAQQKLDELNKSTSERESLFFSIKEILDIVTTNFKNDDIPEAFKTLKAKFPAAKYADFDDFMKGYAEYAQERLSSSASRRYISTLLYQMIINYSKGNDKQCEQDLELLRKFVNAKIPLKINMDEGQNLKNCQLLVYALRDAINAQKKLPDTFRDVQTIINKFFSKKSELIDVINELRNFAADQYGSAHSEQSKKLCEAIVNFTTADPKNCLDQLKEFLPLSAQQTRYHTR